MFPSISRAIPQSQVTTSFVATQAMTIVPVTAFDIKVNGQVPTNPAAVSVVTGDVVSATITTPPDYVWHNFYYYTIDDVPQTFAVVNKSQYTIHIKPEDAILRWYLYPVTVHNLTFKSSTGANTPVTLGNKFDKFSTDVHVVLDPITESVYFYNKFGIQVSKVTLPAAPVAYVKIPEKQTIVVLILGGESYEIYLDSTTSGNSPFFARRNYSEFTGDTSFVMMLPGEDIISYLRRSRAKKTIPPATCITYNGTYLIAAGNGSVWVVDPFTGFNLINTFDIDEYVLNIAPLPDNQGVILVTQSHKVYTMDLDGNMTMIYQGTAVWQPALFNGKVYIPESEIGYLKVYNPATKKFEADITLMEFSPSYTTVDGGKLYVCGHDSERVLVFDAAMNQTQLTFPKKVTWVSVSDNSYIASHWLQDYKILNVRDLFRIVEISFRNRTGPVTHIGTDENLVTPLGNEEVYAHTPSNAWLWLNGRRTYSNGDRGTLCAAGDYIAINYSARVPGKSRTNCVIGDTAYDYDVEAIAQTYYPRNIDLQVEKPQLQNVHTRTIILPKYFTSCRMSVEFGIIKVNDAYYYGDTTVNPGDKVTVEINTRGNSALPVFTIGARQFVIPISTNAGNTAPVVSQLTELEPTTPVRFEVEFGQLGSQFDYIIPGYYDITVKKNNVNITGNYYQQFGKGDKLVVEFVSSDKKYDIKDVYILGTTNYKFVAKNKMNLAVDYLDFGNIAGPYVRQLDTQITSNTAVINSVNVNYYEEPTIQYTSGNLTISGLAPGTSGNISIEGGDSYFVLNGNLLPTTFTITVINDDKLALARNVLSYFDVPVTVVQHIPTGDEDGFIDQPVGTWGLLNRDIDPITGPDINTGDVANRISVGEPDVLASVKLIDTMFALNRLVARNIFSAPESRDVSTKVSARATGLAKENADASAPTAVRSPIDITSTKPLTVVGSVGDLEAIKLSADRGAIIVRTYQSNRTIFSSREVIDIDSVLKDTGGTRTLQSDNIQLALAANVNLFASNDKDVVALATSTNSENISVMLSAGVEYLRSRASKINSASVDLFADTLSVDVAGKVGYLDNLVSVLDGSTVRHLDFKTEKIIPASSARHLDFKTEKIIPASSARHLDFKTEKIILASTANLLSSFDSVGDASSARNFVQAISIVTGSQSQFSNVSEIMSPSGNISVDTVQYSVLRTSNPIVSNAKVIIDRASTLELYTNYEPPRNFITPRSYDVSPLLDRNYRWQGFALPQTRNKTSAVVKNINANPSSKTSVVDVDDVQYAGYRTPAPVASSGRPQEVKQSLPSQLLDNFVNAEQFSPGIRPLNYWLNNERPLKDDASLEPKVKTEIRYFGENNVNNRQLFKILADETTLVFTGFDKLELSGAVKNPLVPAATGSETYLSVTLDYTQEKLSLAQAEPNMFVTYYDDPQGLVVGVYQADDLLNIMQARLTYRPADAESSTGAKLDYAKETLLGEVLARGQYAQETLLDWSTKSGAVPQREQEYAGVTDHIPMQRFSLAGFTYNSSLAKLEHYTQSVEGTITWSRERPEYFYPSSRTIAEFEQGVEWDNDIDVEYGAFATIEDANYAARYYQSFRPYLIMDTDLWTYRVLLDTNLVCPLPKGRYPVAWLMRGG